MKRRSVLAAGLCAVLAALAAACDDAAETARPPAVAVVLKTFDNPFFLKMREGAERAGRDLAAAVTTHAAGSETAVQEQIEIVGRLAARDDVDAIVIAPIDSRALVPALRRARDAGKVLVNLDNRLSAGALAESGLAAPPFVSVDNRAAAYVSAKYATFLIEGPTRAAIIGGIAGTTNGDDRVAGAMLAFSENPDISVAGVRYADWKREDAARAAAALFADAPDIGLIFCANDMMAFGVLDHLRANGPAGVLVAAFDALPEAVALIRAGELTASVDQLPAVQGYRGVEIALDALAGRPTPREAFVDPVVINANTLPAAN